MYESVGDSDLGTVPSTPPSSNPYYAAWNVAWGNRTLSDHGASTWTGATYWDSSGSAPSTNINDLPYTNSQGNWDVITNIYGLGYYNSKYYYADHVNHSYYGERDYDDYGEYRLYQWSGSSWASVYNSSGSSSGGGDGVVPPSGNSYYAAWNNAWGHRNNSDHGASYWPNNVSTFWVGTSNITVYAKWSKAITGTSMTSSISPTSYVYDGSTHCPTPTVQDESTTLTSGTDYSISCSTTSTVGSKTATLSGSSVYNSATKAFYTGSTSKTYYINNATLTFNATTNGGTGGGTVYTKTGVSVVYGGIRSTTTTSIPTATPPSGGSLNGWYTSSSGGTKVLNANGSFAGSVSGYTNGTNWTTTQDRTLYAQYTSSNNTITLNKNGGFYNGSSSGTAYIDVTPSSNRNNSIGKAYRSGKNFIGWYTTTSGGTQVFDANGYATTNGGYWTGSSSTSNSVSGLAITSDFSDFSVTTNSFGVAVINNINSICDDWFNLYVDVPDIAVSGSDLEENFGWELFDAYDDGVSTYTTGKYITKDNKYSVYAVYNRNNSTATIYVSSAINRTWASANNLTLYARFTNNSTTVTFNDNGGTGGEGTTTYDYEDDNYIESDFYVSTPTRSGYTFLGYYDAQSGGTRVWDQNGHPDTESGWIGWEYGPVDLWWIYSQPTLTVYARWSKTVSSLTKSVSPTSYIYDGSSHCPTPTVQDGSTTLTNNTDYTYSCSSNTNVGTATVTITGRNVYNSTTTAYYSGTTTVSFYINNATLTFNANGGSGGGTVYTKTGATGVYTGIRNTTAGSIPTVTPPAQKQLKGWYTASSGGTKVLNANGTFTGTAVNGYTTASAWATTTNQTLYAQYENANYTLTFNANGGTVSPTSVSKTYGQTVTDLPTPIRTGYKFEGWYANIGGSASGVINMGRGYNYTNVISIHASAYLSDWSILNTTSSDIAILSSTEAGGYEIVFEGGTAKTLSYYLMVGTSYVIISTGQNWGVNNISPGWHDFDLVYNGSTVTAYYDGSVVGTSSKTGTINYNATANLYVGAEATASSFDGNSTFPGYVGNVVIKNTSTLTPSTTYNSWTIPGQNATLYAKWTPNIYTISLDNQSATTAGTTTIYEKYATGYYLNSAATTQMTTSTNGITVPTKTGYTFMGYYTQTSGGGTQYINASGKLTSNASNTNFTSNGTLYAHWSRTKLTITETVKGNQADSSKEFNFTINVKNNGTGISDTYAYTGSKSGNLTFSSGNATFTLHHGQHIDIYFPTGYTYTITQTNGDYTLTKTNDTGTFNGTDITSVFTDTLSSTTPTGLFLDILPYLLLLLMVLVSGAYLYKHSKT